MTEPPTLLYKDCISIHIPVPIEGHATIDWDPPRSSSERIRVHDYTCSCSPTFYELCQSGGQLFIRRTRRSDQLIVDESPRACMIKAMILWANLLNGAAA